MAGLRRRAGIRGEAAGEDHDPRPRGAAHADAIRRDFTADAPKVNCRWLAVTYIETWEGWLYLATVIDIASRPSAAPLLKHVRTELATDALAKPRPRHDLPLRSGLPHPPSSRPRRAWQVVRSVGAPANAPWTGHPVARI